MENAEYKYLLEKIAKLEKRVEGLEKNPKTIIKKETVYRSRSNYDFSQGTCIGGF